VVFTLRGAIAKALGAVGLGFSGDLRRLAVLPPLPVFFLRISMNENMNRYYNKSAKMK